MAPYRNIYYFWSEKKYPLVKNLNKSKKKSENV